MGSVRIGLGQGQQRVSVLCPIGILQRGERPGLMSHEMFQRRADSCADCLKGTTVHILDNSDLTYL